MLISQAFAASETAAPATAAATDTPAIEGAATDTVATTGVATPAPAGDLAAYQPSSTPIWMMTAVMLVLFYVLMIRPQQKRFKKQMEMQNALKKGDKVIIAGGLVGTVSRIVNEGEVEVDLGDTKVSAMRYSVMLREEPAAPAAKDKKAA